MRMDPVLKSVSVDFERMIGANFLGAGVDGLFRLPAIIPVHKRRQRLSRGNFSKTALFISWNSYWKLLFVPFPHSRARGITAAHAGSRDATSPTNDCSVLLSSPLFIQKKTSAGRSDCFILTNFK